MRTTRAAILLIACAALLATGCGDDDPTGTQTNGYEGITRTDAVGNILENDPDDWKGTAFLHVFPAYPNPANGSTTLVLAISAEAPVTVTIRTPSIEVRHLYAGPLPMGTHHLVWDGTDDGGTQVPAGIYRAIIIATEGTSTKHYTHGDIELVRDPGR